VQRFADGGELPSFNRSIFFSSKKFYIEICVAKSGKKGEYKESRKRL
jgi:hypothetical protein